MPRTSDLGASSDAHEPRLVSLGSAAFYLVSHILFLISGARTHACLSLKLVFLQSVCRIGTDKAHSLYTYRFLHEVEMMDESDMTDSWTPPCEKREHAMHASVDLGIRHPIRYFVRSRGLSPAPDRGRFCRICWLRRSLRPVGSGQVFEDNVMVRSM